MDMEKTSKDFHPKHPNFSRQVFERFRGERASQTSKGIEKARQRVEVQGAYRPIHGNLVNRSSLFGVKVLKIQC